ncbi:hypothetical protein QTP88_011756, partial [Uroleucon formosanum]
NCICFVPVYECTGENLANTIIQKLKEIGLSLEFLRGQGYDSGANMSDGNSNKTIEDYCKDNTSDVEAIMNEILSQ